MTQAQPLDALFEQARHAASLGRLADSASIYRHVLTISPDHPRALNALGNHALNAGDARAAQEYFQRAVTRDPKAPALWLNLSNALHVLGDADGELKALDGALVADPYFVIALLQKAQWFERYSRQDDAVTAYRSLLDAAPPLDTLAPTFQAALRHGQALVTAHDEAQDKRIRAALDDALPRSARFDHALEILSGRRKIHYPRPIGLFFPHLPFPEYFDRALFPWFDTIEAAWETMRDELLAMLRDGDRNVPYVNIAPGTPVNQWELLNNSLDWGAIFLVKDGEEVAANAERCPQTMAVLRQLPLLDIPARGPTVMFSTLSPHAGIPPHHGVTNIRSVVHLPLIVPEGCGFRVGDDTRHWQPGKAWAFDDTIEHEAWNDSDETRVILILDAWNPYLDENERAMLRQANHILGQLGG